MSDFGIWCVSVGSMGHREAWAKDIDGQEMTFASEAEARQKAQDMNKTVNGPFSRASINYSARARD